MAFPANAQPQSQGRSLHLGSWKEIAAYLKRGERTARRWEQAEGLPVHRHVHEKAASVYAYSGELDAWVQSRGAKTQAEAAEGAPRSQSRLSRLKVLATVLGVFVAGGVVTAVLTSRPFGNPELIAAPLTTYPGDELDPSFSPDGSQVVFSWNGLSQDNFDIYIKTIGQENYVRITRDPGEDFNPVWSPYGRSIAFLRELGEQQAAVMLAPPVGGAEVMLAKFHYPHIPGFRTSFPASFLSWHSSSKYLIAAAPEVGPFTLHLISLTGEVRNLTSAGVTAGLGDLNPTFSPNGQTVAFTRYFSSGFGGQMYTLALSPDGKTLAEPRRVSWAASNAISAVWAHNGRELVYQRYGEHTLWITTAFEPSTPRHLSVHSAEIQNPAISHNSRSLAFSSGRRDLDIARSEISSLVTEPHVERVISSTRLDTEARLSPDNRRIVFGSERSGGREIWISSADGSEARQLTNLGNAINEQPSWSPDGKRIAFDSRRSGGNGRIYIVQADQPAINPVTNGYTDDSTPRWSHDGKWLYFSSNRNGRSAIWKASTSNLGDQHQVTIHGGDGPIESPDGQYLYYVHRSALPGPQHLWRLKTSTGAEEALLQSRNINWWDFVPDNNGVYFVDSSKTNAGRFLHFYEFGTRQSRRVAQLPKSYYCCPDISNDRRHVYYSVLKDVGHDLMVVQNFH
jgi:Tol biopolymer transport system component